MRRSVKVDPHRATIGLEGSDVIEAALNRVLHSWSVSVSVWMRLWALLTVVLFHSRSKDCRRTKLQFLLLLSSLCLELFGFDFMIVRGKKRLNYRLMHMHLL